MKRLTILCLLICWTFSGCSKKEVEEVFKPSLEVESDVAEYLSDELTGSIPVKSNVEWTVSLLADADWITVTKENGAIQLKMIENETVNERVAKLKMVGVDGNVSRIVIVKQHGNTPTLIVDKAEIAVEPTGADNLEVVVKSNMEWGASTNAEWLTVVREEDMLTISVAPSTQPGARIGIISVKGELPISGKSITITQQGTVAFEADKTTLSFGLDPEEAQEVLVTTNLEWTVENPHEEWLTVVREGDKLSFTATPNPLLSRVGYVTLKSPELDIRITVNQAGNTPNTTEFDRQVLIKLYNTMGGTASTLGWDITQPLTVSSAWNGVTIAAVDGKNRVTRLTLTAKGLAGPIPTEIGYLTEILEIRMENNYFITGTLPTTIGNLSKLKLLLLQRSELTGTIPVEFAQLESLENFAIHTNKLSGSVPANIFGRLTKLMTLEIKDNNFSGELPADLLSHPNVSKFNFANICPQRDGYTITNCP